MIILLIFTILFISLTFGDIKLITPAQLRDFIKDKNTVVIDLRKSIKDYWKGHIPRAQWVSVEAFRFPKNGTPAFFIDPDLFVEKLKNLGIDRNTKVVLYDDKGTFIAFYVAWGLDLIGHPEIYVLEGGYNRYVVEGFPVTKEHSSVIPKKDYGNYKVREDIRADIEEVKEALKNKEYIFLDARPPELYKGEKGFWKRLGHIKGAVNRFWRQDFEEVEGKKGLKYYLLRPKDEIALFYESLGIGEGKKVILYCGQGLMSAATYYVLRYYLKVKDEVKLYDGSWNEYSQTDLPAEP